MSSQENNWIYIYYSEKPYINRQLTIIHMFSLTPPTAETKIDILSRIPYECDLQCMKIMEKELVEHDNFICYDPLDANN